MPFWDDPRFKEVVRQVLIALLLALLSVLGYDQAVARPRLEAALRERAVVALAERAAGDAASQASFSFCQEGRGCVDVTIRCPH
jgi:hypothetical protein